LIASPHLTFPRRTKLAILRTPYPAQHVTSKAAFAFMATVSEPHLRGPLSSVEREAALRRIDRHSNLPIEPEPTGRSLTRLLVGPIVLALLGVAAMNFDMPLAHWVRGKHYPSDVKKLFDLAEVFGHGFGVVFIIFAVWVLAPQMRLRLPRVIVAVFAAGIAGTLFKMCVARRRPNHVVFFNNGVMETFGEWLPLFSNPSAWQSFPSGHSAMACGLAVALTALFPRGKWLFAGLAVMVMLQRICSGYHFLSDTLWGAAIGCLVASAFVSNSWLSQPLARLEQRFAAD
jgi:membrane-associated phospholipid phosphatase